MRQKHQPHESTIEYDPLSRSCNDLYIKTVQHLVQLSASQFTQHICESRIAKRICRIVECPVSDKTFARMCQKSLYIDFQYHLLGRPSDNGVSLRRRHRRVLVAEITSSVQHTHAYGFSDRMLDECLPLCPNHAPSKYYMYTVHIQDVVQRKSICHAPQLYIKHALLGQRKERPPQERASFQIHTNIRRTLFNPTP